jgi:hypothetical protein
MRKKSALPDDEIDLSLALTEIIGRIVRSSSALGHIDPERTLVCVGSNRSGARGGVYGKLVPLKFKDGAPALTYRGRVYAIPEVSLNGRPCLYIIYFYMPRFFDLPWEEKLRVIFHELYHISPRFDGDIRRMAAVKTAHGRSKKRFDSHFAGELGAFIEAHRDTPLADFLKLDSSSMYRRYRRVNGIRMKHPKPVVIK